MKSPFLLLAAAFMIAACGRKDDRFVVLYSSVDEAYSRPLCRMFTERSGITVKLVTDTEAAKSAGLVTRLLAEKDKPQADLFWSGDAMRAVDLASRGLAAKLASSDPQPALEAMRQMQAQTGLLCGPARLRVILYHKPSLSSPEALPQTVADLATPRFASRACMANPLFGTTSMHAAALLQQLGRDGAQRFFEDFTKHGGRMLASNGEVKRRVGSGEFAMGLTDSDDVNVSLLDNLPVSFIVPDQAGAGAVLVPSAIMLVAKAPHPSEAQALAQFLASAENAEWMAKGSGAHFPMHDLARSPGSLGLSLDRVRLAELDDQRLSAEFENWRVSFLEDWVRKQQY